MPCIDLSYKSGCTSSFRKTVSRFLFHPIHNPKTKWGYLSNTGLKVSKPISLCTKIHDAINKIYQLHSRTRGISAILQQEAYLQILVFPSQNLFLLFARGDQHFHFFCSTTIQPLSCTLFTKVPALLLRLLHTQGVNVTGYLGGVLLKHFSAITLSANVEDLQFCPGNSFLHALEVGDKACQPYRL